MTRAPSQSNVPVELELTPTLLRELSMRGRSINPGGEIEAEAMEAFRPLLSALLVEARRVDVVWTSTPQSAGFNQFFGMSALLCSRLRMVVEAAMLRSMYAPTISAEAILSEIDSQYRGAEILSKADPELGIRYDWFDWLMEALAEQGYYVGSVLPLEFLEEEELFRERLLRTLRGSVVPMATTQAAHVATHV